MTGRDLKVQVSAGRRMPSSALLCITTILMPGQAEPQCAQPDEPGPGAPR